MIATQQDKTLEDAIAHTMTRLRGAYSVAILTEEALIGIRDAYGVRPSASGCSTTSIMCWRPRHAL